MRYTFTMFETSGYFEKSSNLSVQNGDFAKGTRMECVAVELVYLPGHFNQVCTVSRRVSFNCLRWLLYTPANKFLSSNHSLLRCNQTFTLQATLSLISLLQVDLFIFTWIRRIRRFLFTLLVSCWLIRATTNIQFPAKRRWT
ncbi:hypothetical protein HBI56_222870 [Parastagonospora nodorum]|uniref:Uncharacterized protein n=1 Tax=Phaeosphaeria nodorum (strain SN15 / ATCC MYA-4574 / FGSC 10173) TaxID=321614 RepID=A0A7U2EY76_PHANO|nr:hypothetical protein HBH56_148100 [Parastagonospora nodorum]QRC94083.1 hypothetical protein JI435_430190 [Parastagonospora nodorum SN15]KAH3923235.1 hypothetical protein HBH54_212740 [Parastagonospora nodorum]KAH3945868.1 hypothetical protein HBH53_135560 [Parastagonospora nodorum]KAH3983919.1 hypothetical protein HBH52_064460 [Parastagonospora nodorum]